MLNWIITVFVLAVVSAILGFSGMAGIFADVVQFLTALFIVVFLAGLVYDTATGRNTTPPMT